MSAPTAAPPAGAEALRREVAVLGLLHPHGTRVTPAVHLGVPAGPRVWLPLPTRPTHSRVSHHDPYAADPALRRDAAARLVEAATAAGLPRDAWVVRGGGEEVHEPDLHWEVALRAAHAEVGLALASFRVVTRTGWREPATGREQRWRRLRVRGREAGAAIERTGRALQQAAQSQVCTGSLLCIRSA